MTPLEKGPYGNDQEETTMAIIACDTCGYTGTTHPGRHSPDRAGAECYACEDGTMVEFVQASTYQGAVEALEAIERHGDMPAGEPWNTAYVEVVMIAREALAAVRGQSDA